MRSASAAACAATRAAGRARVASAACTSHGWRGCCTCRRCGLVRRRRFMKVFLRSASYLLAAVVVVTAFGCNDNDDHVGVDAGVQVGYVATPLLSNQVNVAPHQDGALVNAWGLAMDTQSF